MEKKFVVAYTIIGIAASVFLTCWLGVHGFRTRKTNIANASSRMSEIDSIVASVSVSRESLNSQIFKEKIHAIFSNDPHLDLLAIYDQYENPQYLYARNKFRLDEGIFSNGMPRKSPTFSVHPLLQSIVTRDIPVPNSQILKVALVSTVLTREDMLPRVKLFLVGMVALTLITAMLLVILSMLKTKAPETSAQPSTTGTEPDTTMEAKLREAPFASSTQPGMHTTEAVDTEKEETFCGLFSPRSGLGWEEFLEERLTYELKRVASFDQDLVLAVFTVKGVVSNDDYKLLASKVKENFPFHDLTFEFGQNGFSIILPNMDIDEGMRKIKLFQRVLLQAIAGKDIIVCVGVSSRNGRLLSGNQLIKEAVNSLAKAEGEKKSCVIGFRSDPAKYRNFVAEKRYGAT